MKKLKTLAHRIALLTILILASISCSRDDIMDESIDTNRISSETYMNEFIRDQCLIEPMKLPLKTEQESEVGYVNVTNDEDYLYVTYVAHEGWLISEVQLYVGTKEGVPLAKHGEPDRKKFPYNDKFKSPVASYEYVIPLSELDECFVVLAHAKTTDCETSCECDGKATKLTLKYDGAESAQITVTQKKDNVVVFDQIVAPGEEFSFEGTDKGTLGTEIKIMVNGIENTKIHTSCSKPLYIGMVSGDFTIVDGYSKNGGQLCEKDTPEEPECGDCDGKVTNLTMTYDGDSEAKITVKQKKDGGIVFDDMVMPGAEFSFIGTDKGTLGTEISLYVDGELSTKIHTSCSKPIYIGMTSGDFTIVDGYSKNGGQLCDTYMEEDKKDPKHEEKDKCKKESSWADGGITFEEYFDTDRWGYLGEYCVEECCKEWIVYGLNLNGGTEPLDDAIYAYDLNAQTQTLVYDPTPIDANQNYPNALAFDAYNQRLYFGTSDGRLYYHVLGTDTHVQVEGNATSGSFGTMAGGSWYEGKFYYVENGTNQLWQVSIEEDVATRTPFGTVPTNNGYGDLAFDPANSGVFIASAGAPTSVWYAYDLDTKSSVVLARDGGDDMHNQLAFGSNGTLYAVNATSGQFYTVNYDWDAATVGLIADWDSPYTYTDLASGPQCE